jgi:acetylornithine deacetylase
MLTQLEQRVLAAIDEAALLDDIRALVAHPSLGGTPAELSVQHEAARIMRDTGMDVDVWDLDLPTLYQHPQASWEVERSAGLGVVGTLGSDRGGRSLLFNGHVDVVPAGDLTRWHSDPFVATVRDGRVYGRGALDMKGGLSCAIAAARAIQHSGVTLKGLLKIQSVIGEEEGGIGTLAAILRGHTADAAIVAEPTELKVAPAQAGAHNFRLTVFGAAAHGCVREEGVSAIEKFSVLLQAIVRLERERNDRLRANDPTGLFQRYRTPNAICIGTVRGGEWASSESEICVAEGRFGISVGEDPLDARRELEAAVAAAAVADPWMAAHPPTVEWWGGTFDPGLTDVNHPIVGLTAASHRDSGAGEPVLEGMTYGADMRLLTNVAAIPTLLYGPGDVRLAHRPDESVAVADLLAATRTFVLAILRWIGVEEEA